MGKKGKKRSSYDEEEEENQRIRRKVERLVEKELERKKKKRRKRSPSQSSSMSQSSSRGRSRSLSRGATRRWTRRSKSRERSRARSRSGRSQTRRSTTEARSRSSRSRSRSTNASSGNARARGSPRRSNSRSSEGPASDVEAQRTEADGKAQMRPIAITPAGGLAQENAAVTEQPGDPAPAIPEHEIELQQEVLEVIGSRLESETIIGAAIHKDVALRWAEIVRKGLPEDEVKTILEKYPIPENCKFIACPKVNVEITAAVQETALKRDKRIVEKQERVAACLAAMGKAITIVLKLDIPEKMQILESMSDGSRLIASIHREESLARKGLMLANLNSSLKTTLANTSVNEWLFGEDLDEKLKTAKNLEKTSNDLKPPVKPVQQSIAQRNTKNTKGPPRQSSYKNRSTMSGGRRQYNNNNNNKENIGNSQNNRSDAKKTFDRQGSSRFYRKRR